jgi:hypothetical protein
MSSSTWKLLPGVISLLWPVAAQALDECSVFSVQPGLSDVVRCVNQLTEQVNLLEGENRLLKTYICSFAVEDWARDKGSLGASIFEDDCPKPRLKKPPQKK